MREILFRGKDRKTGEWRFGSLVHQTDYYGNKVDDYFILDGTDTEDYDIGPAYRVIPETVGQYTEFEDSNGAKIFEGDILRCHYNCKDIKNTLCVCEQDRLNPCFVLRNIKNEYDVEYDFVKCGLLDLEVIGNIYDNPELLKGEES